MRHKQRLPVVKHVTQLRAAKLDERRVTLNASVPESCEFKLEAAEGENKLRRFSMTAYTGAAMNVGFGAPVVVDIQGVSTARQDIPILKGHDHDQIVGHTAEVTTSPQRIRAAGLVSGVGDAAGEVVALAGNGFPWQASIGGDVLAREYVDKGEKVTVNGRSFSGPLIVVRKFQLNEISFVSLGADGSTSASVAAKATDSKEQNMNPFDTWLASLGFSADHMTEAQLKAMRSQFDAIEAAKKPETKPEVKADKSATEDAINEVRAAASKEAKRLAKINSIFAGKTFEGVDEMKAKAIDEGWESDKAELECLRASRPAAPAIHIGTGSLKALAGNENVIEAAVCQHGRLENIEKQYDDKTMQAAHDAFRGQLGLHDLLLHAARSNGYTGVSVKADPRGVLKAAFSTLSLPGILGNVANKFLLAGFNSVESTWRDISAIRSVSDFKTITSYRMTDGFIYEEIGKGGSIPHGETSEESYTNAAKTYGKMYSITRTDIINDDLDALTAVPTRIGNGAAKKLNLVFWTEFLDNSTFFTDDHGTPDNDNYDDGTDSALGVDSLTAAELLFMNLVQPDGTPMAVMPRILLVPNALYVTATRLMNSVILDSTAALTSGGVEFGTSNPHAGKFKVLRSAYLSNTTLTGYSVTKWYLLASPSEVPVIETCFLNGNQSPTVESADADFNTLGIQMRGYHDFGVAKQDYRGGVGMKGTT